ncbi:MAG: hypothetical protein DRO39_07040 [Thermoprotei archaeon]|nr:MAG: hypothetical protein DRO39_07040 [Thermoprotei archaeon]
MVKMMRRSLLQILRESNMERRALEELVKQVVRWELLLELALRRRSPFLALMLRNREKVVR